MDKQIRSSELLVWEDIYVKARSCGVDLNQTKHVVNARASSSQLFPPYRVLLPPQVRDQNPVVLAQRLAVLQETCLRNYAVASRAHVAAEIARRDAILGEFLAGERRKKFSSGSSSSLVAGAPLVSGDRKEKENNQGSSSAKAEVVDAEEEEVTAVAPAPPRVDGALRNAEASGRDSVLNLGASDKKHAAEQEAVFLAPIERGPGFNHPHCAVAGDEVACGFSFINGTAMAVRTVQEEIAKAREERCKLHLEKKDCPKRILPGGTEEEEKSPEADCGKCKTEVGPPRVILSKGDYFTKPRVCIIDVDVHHGNGTQAVFYEDPTVLFISIHRGALLCERFSSSDYVGAGRGEGYSINSYVVVAFLEQLLWTGSLVILVVTSDLTWPPRDDCRDHHLRGGHLLFFLNAVPGFFSHLDLLSTSDRISNHIRHTGTQ